MESKKEKASVFCTYEDDIKRLYKTEEERERVIKILREAEEQSEKKEIKQVRKHKPVRKFFLRLMIKMRYGIHWSKPFYPFRLARNFFLAYMYKVLRLKKYVFRGIEFAITFKCNFTCTHCLCARIDETETRKELEPEDYRRLVNEAMKYGATTFGLEGGEPLVKKDWEAIVKSFKPHYNHVIISTNGYLFDEGMAQKCARLGVDTVNFSLDSGIPELHDLFRRRKGSHEKVLKAIALCKKYKIKPLINTVVHKGNLYTDGFLKLLEFAENEGVMVNILFAKGVGEFKDKNSMLVDDDFRAYGEITRPYAYVHIHHQGPLNYNYGSSGCPGTKEMFNMTPYGDVINCANMHVYLGNVREESLAAIREKAIQQSPFGEYRPCFLTLDNDFMNIYYPLLEKKQHVSLEEFREALKEYEKKHNKVVFPELHKD